MIFFRGVSPHFQPFWSFDDKGGEIWVSLQGGLPYVGIFFLSYNSRSSDDFDVLSCKLKLYGGLILLLCFPACLFLININAHTLNYISHHISSCISNSSYYMLNACMDYKVQGEISMILLFKVFIASKANSSLCTSLGGVLLYLAIKFLNISIYTSYVYPR